MIHTSICTLFDIAYPIVLGGMETGPSAPMVAAVSRAGGLGMLGAANLTAAQVLEQVAAIRTATDKPFGVSFPLFCVKEESFTAALQARPPVMAFAWARPDQELHAYFQRVHDAGLKAMYTACEVPEARRAAEAGADVIVAQGTEGAGHVGWMATMALVPMIVNTVAPCPVLAAGGIADGRGLAAALALGAEGVVLGTRLLATDESPLDPNFKRAIVDSDGHDTILTAIPDIAFQQGWPGGVARVRRNRFIEHWAGREWALRQHAPEVGQTLLTAHQAGDADHATVPIGQDAGLIDTVLPAAEVIRRMVEQAHEIMTARLPHLCQRQTHTSKIEAAQTRRKIATAAPKNQHIHWPIKTRELYNHHLDSTIWNDFQFRNDDIIISSYAKSGTTWVQQIVAQMMFGGDPELQVAEMSLWLDLRIPSKDVKLAMVEAQRHRRFLTTHLPVDALVFSPKAKYIYVGRDGRDIVWSLYHHHVNANPKWYKTINDKPGRVGPPIAPPPQDILQYWHTWFERDGYPFWPFWENIRTWWSVRELPNVMLVHFTNLKQNMSEEMRRIAAFLDIPTDATRWAAILEYCSFDWMKQNAAKIVRQSGTFWDNCAHVSINQGVNGRWTATLTSNDVMAYEARAVKELGPECTQWLATGEGLD